MANANAIADQMMKLGLRHGEKAGIAIASMVFFLCVGAAVSRPTIDTSPEQVKKAAEASEQNLNRHEERETIIKNLEEREKITKTNFAETVEEQIKITLVPDNYKAARPWVTPEPGAGLIRSAPDLIAPSELYAYPGRGGLLVFALDQEGKRIALKEGEEKEEQKQRYGRRKKKSGGMGGGMGGMMGGGQRKKKKGKSKDEIAREEKEERERLAKRKLGTIIGSVEETKDTTPENEGENTHDFKEITKGYRWVAITGTLDHGRMLANYRDALKNPAVAHPNYARLDVQRKTLQPDGTWTEWKAVNADKNLNILDNLPELDEEFAPETVRPKSLVDPLPFLQAGLWEKVHIASLVPREKVETPDEDMAKGRMPGMPGMRGMPGMGSMGGSMPGMGQQQSMMSMMMVARQKGGMMGGGGSQGMGSMGSMMGMGASAESAGNYWKSDEKKVMIRALDFTVEADNTYRYRSRIVVFNPNYQRDDVSPGTDKTSKTLKGPWSKETDQVTMPPDVMPYAIDTQLPPAIPVSDVKVVFQVVRFHPSDGVTVPRTFDATVGDLIGEFKRTEVPVSDGSGKKLEPIDFTSHQIVLDLAGGGRPLMLPAGLVGPPIERPVLATLLRPDGSIAVHGQPDDEANEVRKDMAANYTHEIEQSSKKREHSQGSGSSDMMQNMMRSMMGGGGGGRGR